MTDETCKLQVFAAFDVAPSLFELLLGYSKEYSILVFHLIFTPFILSNDGWNLEEKSYLYTLTHFESIDSFPIFSRGFFKNNVRTFLDVWFTYMRNFNQRGGDKKGENNENKQH